MHCVRCPPKRTRFGLVTSSKRRSCASFWRVSVNLTSMFGADTPSDHLASTSTCWDCKDKSISLSGVATTCDCWFDWCCFYFFVRNSLVALLEALCNQAKDLLCWAKHFWIQKCTVGQTRSQCERERDGEGESVYKCVCEKERECLWKRLCACASKDECAWLSVFMCVYVRER